MNESIKGGLSRRSAIAGGLAAMVVPRHVLGGVSHQAPVTNLGSRVSAREKSTREDPRSSSGTQGREIDYQSTPISAGRNSMRIF